MKIWAEYKNGRKKNFFVREIEGGLYVLDKITKACSFTIYCGSNEQMEEYLNKNGYKFEGLVYNNMY